MFWRIRVFKYLLGIVLLLILGGVLEARGPNVSLAATPTGNLNAWNDISEHSIIGTGTRLIIPSHYRVLSADQSTLNSILAQAPLESAGVKAKGSQAIIVLPLPGGGSERFSFVEAPVMAAQLSASYPDIRTYLGQGIDDPTATVRFDRTQFGFHAMILSASDTVYIDPYQRGDTTNYISYFKSDYVPPLNERVLENDVRQFAPQKDASNAPFIPSGSQLRTYRLALAATGEYSQFYGGTVQGALAGMVTSVNRVDGVYERELAVRLVLIANDSQLIYTNAATDPYTNNDGLAMLDENQSNLDTVIGSANYDIGHVFSTGGGGVAGLGVVCIAGEKAQGVTGSSSPIGDNFDIDYVAHEMGHQYGGNHSFNGTTSNCGGGNRNGSTAVEPGSGSTIMAYAGICGAEDLQPHSDAYFHTVNFSEIVAYTTSGSGNSCAAITNTGNTPPVVNAGISYTIPNLTPFKVTGSATDADSDPLTYDWEQFDHGAAAPPNTDNGNRAIFRSFNPVTVPYRYLPKLSNILSNTLTFGEAFPTTNRVLTFRLTARDNRAGGGGVNFSTVTLNVTTSSGPFQVTQPNTAVTWTANSIQTVAWDVANTTAAPVSCPNVDITLSADGGNSFAYTLASGTTNDGTEDVTVPNIGTSMARVMVSCSSNIFLDISNANFIITGGPTVTPAPTGTGTVVQATATRTVTSGLSSTPSVTSTRTSTALVTATTSLPSPSATTIQTSATITATATSTHTATNVAPTDTSTTGTSTAVASATSTACTLSFTDVPVDSTFYPFIRCLACRGIISGYNDGTFRPGNDITRGQIAKMVSNAAGFQEDPGPQLYEDVDPTNIFYDWINRLSNRGIMGGYPCGTVPAESCVMPANLPYFRPFANATRGQLAKIVANAGSVGGTPTDLYYTDVPQDNPFYLWIMRLTNVGVISGYPCGGPGEACDDQQRPYFRPFANVTRGQASKIVANTFLPDCQTPQR